MSLFTLQEESTVLQDQIYTTLPCSTFKCTAKGNISSSSLWGSLRGKKCLNIYSGAIGVKLQWFPNGLRID